MKRGLPDVLTVGLTVDHGEGSDLDDVRGATVLEHQELGFQIDVLTGDVQGQQWMVKEGGAGVAGDRLTDQGLVAGVPLILSIGVIRRLKVEVLDLLWSFREHLSQ